MVGYSTILFTIFRPVVAIVLGASRDRGPVVQMSVQPNLLPAAAGILLLVIGGLFMLAFFTFHFGMFHFVHSQFLATFFPIDIGKGAERGMIGLATYAEVVRRYWWFLPSAFLAERAAFLSPSPVSQDGQPVTVRSVLAGRAVDGRKRDSAMAAPYKNVVRMHLLIFFFAGAHFARLDSFAVYVVVYAVYFFPWRLLRSGRAAEPLEAA